MVAIAYVLSSWEGSDEDDRIHGVFTSVDAAKAAVADLSIEWDDGIGAVSADGRPVRCGERRGGRSWWLEEFQIDELVNIEDL